MAGEITWRQMQVPTGAEALRAMATAGVGIQSALSGGAELASQFGKLQDEAMQQKYLSILDAAKTPEAMEALRQSGQLEQFQQGMTPQALAAVRPAADARFKSLNQQILDSFNMDKAKFENQDMKTKQEQAPIVDQAKVFIAKGDRAGFEQLLAANPQLKDQAFLMGMLRDADRQKKQDDLAAEKWALEKTGIGLNQTGAQQRITLGNIDINNATQAAADAEKMRGFEQLITAAGQERKSKAFVDQSALGSVAAELKLPTTKEGLPDWTNYSDEQKRLVNAMATHKGIPTWERAGGSDTASAEILRSRLINSGATPTQMAKLEPLLQSAVNSVGPGIIGNDKARADHQIQMEDALLKAAEGVTPMPITAANSKTFMDAGIALIDKLYEKDSRAKDFALQALGEYAQLGYEVKDEKTGEITRYLPSISELTSAIAAANKGMASGWVGWNSLSDNLKALTAKPEMKKGVANLNNRQARELRRVLAPK